MSASGQKDARVELGIDSNGIVVLRFTVDIDEERMREAIAFVRRGAEATGRVLILCDYQGARSIEPAARAMVLEGLRGVRLEAVAFVGVSFHLRVLATLMTKVFQIVTKQSYPVRFFDTETEARAWLLDQRRARGG